MKVAVSNTDDTDFADGRISMHIGGLTSEEFDEITEWLKERFAPDLSEPRALEGADQEGLTGG